MKKSLMIINGNKYWYKDDLLHRVYGPAVEWADGSKFWYINGQLHREDGPAIECANGDKAWYINGKEYSEKEYKRLTFKSEYKFPNWEYTSRLEMVE